MGTIDLVPLTKLWAPLAPGTVAFSIEATHGCWMHIKHIDTFPAYMGDVRRDGRIKLRHEFFTYDELCRRYRLFLVEPRMITEVRPDTVLTTGATIVAFDVIDKPCACTPHPFVLTSPGWVMTGGITAERLDPVTDKQSGFSLDPAGWLLVVAGWNVPVSPSDLNQGETVLLFDTLGGRVIRHSVNGIRDDCLSFMDGDEVSLGAIDAGYRLFREPPS